MFSAWLVVGLEPGCSLVADHPILNSVTAISVTGKLGYHDHGTMPKGGMPYGDSKMAPAKGKGKKALAKPPSKGGKKAKK